MTTIKKGEQLLADAFLKEHFDRLKAWAIGDIRKACGLGSDGKIAKDSAYIGASILWICAIDFFGGLLTGCYGPRETDRRIKEFVSKYLRKFGHYNAGKLIDLRWSLVHFYTVRHYTLDELQETRKYHLKKIKGRDCLLHLGVMIEDLEKAVEKYTKDLWNKPDLRIRAYRYFQTTKPLMALDTRKMEFLNEYCDI